MSQYIDLMINSRETPSRTTLFYIICLLAVSLLLHLCLRPLRARRRILHLSRAADKMSPQEFFQLRMARRYQHQPDFPGIYILYNKSQRMYYVGQGKRVFQRVNSHFTGHGNGDVYADYKYGDVFTIQIIPLKDSGFRSLNSFERYAIRPFKAFKRGYNKTRGNKH